MRKYLAIAAAALALFSSPASADWTGKNAAGSTLTFSNAVDCTIGICIPIAALVNAAGGTLYGTAGSANAAVLTVQGIASGTPQPISGTVAATQSGTWTVQPGNTANTTAWLVTGTGGTFPSTQSGTWTVQPGNTANTTPWLQSISQGGSTAVVKAANTVTTTDVGLVVAVANTLAPGQAALASSSPVAIAKNSGTGSTVAGAAVGTLGAPSAEYVSVQGPVTGLPTSPGTLAGGVTFVKGTTAAMTGTTSTQIIAAVASNRIYVTKMSCKGDPANAVATKVLIQDGSGGTTLDTLTVAANGGGEQSNGPTPVTWTTSGNGLFAQNVTTGSSVICTASGYSG